MCRSLGSERIPRAGVPALRAVRVRALAEGLNPARLAADREGRASRLLSVALGHDRAYPPCIRRALEMSHLQARSSPVPHMRPT